MQRIPAIVQRCDWDDLRLLLALSRAGSIARAAAQLGVDATTVSRRLDRAEARIGTALVLRRRGAVATTEAGATLVAAAERMELEAERAVAEAAGAAAAIAGTVRVTSVPVLVNRLIAPALPDLAARHPELEIELMPDARALSLTRRETDLALRLARPSTGVAAVCRRVGTLRYALYGAPDAPWIGYVPEMSALPHAIWTEAQAGAQADGPGRLRVGDVETAIALTAAGAGQAALPIAFAPEGARRQTCDVPMREIWLLGHPSTYRRPAIRAVADWLAALSAGLP